MSLSLKKENKKFTYKDYLNWPEDERWEIIDGIAYNFSPAPNRIHQQISGEIFRQISNYLIDKTCQVYSAPFDVRLYDYSKNDENITTVVQPDIVVVCDISKLDDRGCLGAPDLVVEILSQSTGYRDMDIKLNLYERFGVREYWIIHQSDKMMMVFKLKENGEYGKPEVYSHESEVLVGIFDDLTIDLKLVFKE